MKTRLYSLIIGLLMAACFTSHAQELVNDFTILRMDKDFWGCNLFENEDGTLTFKTLMYTPNIFEDYQHLFYKLTPEGEVLDSLIIDAYGDVCDDLHTDLHECLGHGSGKLLLGVDPDALKAYGSTIEEARADLFGLYYIADQKLVELKLTPNAEAYKSQYYTYLMNGLLTQLVRIEPGKNIEEAHMRNRALIAHWVLEQASYCAPTGTQPAVQLIQRDGKTFVQINDYPTLRQLFGRLLAEIQRIKSEGDYDAAQRLVEDYAVKVNPTLHDEILTRYRALNLAPYKGFINPQYIVHRDHQGNITDISLRYDESFAQQMLRYSRDYNTLPLINE